MESWVDVSEGVPGTPRVVISRQAFAVWTPALRLLGCLHSLWGSGTITHGGGPDHTRQGEYFLFVRWLALVATLRWIRGGALPVSVAPPVE